jgi:hypothetical protein
MGPTAGLDSCGYLVHTAIRTPDRPARIDSPHTLSYPNPSSLNKQQINKHVQGTLIWHFTLQYICQYCVDLEGKTVGNCQSHSWSTKSPAFVARHGSLQCSQQPTTAPLFPIISPIHTPSFNFFIYPSKHYSHTYT